MKILLAEDEMLERKAMRKFLETHFSRLVICGEASNGRKAIALAKETEPHIVLMDIQMPGINGLEAMREIRAFLPHVRIIMMTAFDSFKYAQQALQLGATAYILKPSRKEETIEVIACVQAEIEEERAERQKHRGNLVLAQQLFVSKVIHGESGLVELQQRLYPEMKSGYMLAVETKAEKEKATLLGGVHAWTTDEVMIHEQPDHNRIMLLCLSDEKQDTKEAKRLKKRIQLECGKAIRVACGFPRDDVRNLSCSFYEAISALYTEAEDGLSARSSKAKDLQGKFIVAFQAGDEQQALAYRHALQELGETDDEELFYLMKQLLQQLGITPLTVAKESLRGEIGWVRYVQQCCERVKSHFQSMDQIERTKMWVRAHVGQAITLDKAAAYANLSPAYFSNVFKETTGENFVDYVTNVRMKKAVELLAEQRYSLKEISYMVGYKDPNYFSRVFKKQYDVAPSQYITYK